MYIYIYGFVRSARNLKYGAFYFLKTKGTHRQSGDAVHVHLRMNKAGIEEKGLPQQLTYTQAYILCCRTTEYKIFQMHREKLTRICFGNDHLLFMTNYLNDIIVFFGSYCSEYNFFLDGFCSSSSYSSSAHHPTSNSLPPHPPPPPNSQVSTGTSDWMRKLAFRYRKIKDAYNIHRHDVGGNALSCTNKVFVL